jgi:hypothetical protein
VCVLLSTIVPIKLAFATLARACQIQHNTHQAEACQGENGEHGAHEAAEKESIRVHEVPEERAPEHKDAGDNPDQSFEIPRLCVCEVHLHFS